jgi:hypothetical protein
LPIDMEELALIISPISGGGDVKKTIFEDRT